MKLLHVVGTRPNFMKVAPVMDAVREHGIDQRLVHTGQHYDRNLSEAFFEDLELPGPDHFLGVGSGSHAEQTARVMTALEPVLELERPDLVLVPGDVNSTMASAVTAVKAGFALAHLEAGLRSRDRSMPEEHNRVVADHLSDLLLTPSADADENLLGEGIDAERIALVGNVMIDSLRRHEPLARALDVARREHGVEDYLLVTLHRPSLVDVPARLLEVMEALERIGAERPVLFPVHPRTRRRLADAGWRSRRIVLLEPQGYIRFLSLEATAGAVLTDSGGVQEETTALGVPCFTLRTTTERPITLSEGTNRLLGVGSGALAELEEALGAPAPSRHSIPALWDGDAAERVVEAIVRFAGSGRHLAEPIELHR